MQIPWALSATSVAYNVPGAPVAPEPRREDDREDLPRPDHELERPGDQGAEQGREPAGPEDHADLPLRRIGHDLQLHRLPVGRQPGVEVEGRQLDRGHLPDRHRRSRLVRRRRRSSPAPPAASPTSTSRSRSRTTSSSRRSATRPGSTSSRASAAIAAAAAAFTKVPANNEMHIVNPPKSAPLAYPISTYTYVIVPQQTSHAAELRKLIFWALTQGQKAQYTAKLLFVPLPEAGARRVREDAEDDSHLGRQETSSGSRGPRHAGAGLDLAAGGRDHVLDDREAEAGAARGARGVGAVEALEEAREVALADADAVVPRGELRPARARRRTSRRGRRSGSRSRRGSRRPSGASGAGGARSCSPSTRERRHRRARPRRRAARRRPRGPAAPRSASARRPRGRSRARRGRGSRRSARRRSRPRRAPGRSARARRRPGGTRRRAAPGSGPAACGARARPRP